MACSVCDRFENSFAPKKVCEPCGLCEQCVTDDTPEEFYDEWDDEWYDGSEV